MKISLYSTPLFAKPRQNYCGAKVLKQKTAPVFDHDIKNLAKIGVPFNSILYIIGHIYFN